MPQLSMQPDPLNGTKLLMKNMTNQSDIPIYFNTTNRQCNLTGFENISITGDPPTIKFIHKQTGAEFDIFFDGTNFNILSDLTTTGHTIVGNKPKLTFRDTDTGLDSYVKWDGGNIIMNDPIKVKQVLGFYDGIDEAAISYQQAKLISTHQFQCPSAIVTGTLSIGSLIIGSVIVQGIPDVLTVFGQLTASRFNLSGGGNIQWLNSRVTSNSSFQAPTIYIGGTLNLSDVASVLTSSHTLQAPQVNITSNANLQWLSSRLTANVTTQVPALYIGGTINLTDVASVLTISHSIKTPAVAIGTQYMYDNNGILWSNGPTYSPVTYSNNLYSNLLSIYGLKGYVQAVCSSADQEDNIMDFTKQIRTRQVDFPVSVGPVGSQACLAYNGSSLISSKPMQVQTTLEVQGPSYKSVVTKLHGAGYYNNANQPRYIVGIPSSGNSNILVVVMNQNNTTPCVNIGWSNLLFTRISTSVTKAGTTVYVYYLLNPYANTTADITVIPAVNMSYVIQAFNVTNISKTFTIQQAIAVTPVVSPITAAIAAYVNDVVFNCMSLDTTPPVPTSYQTAIGQVIYGSENQYVDYYTSIDYTSSAITETWTSSNPGDVAMVQVSFRGLDSDKRTVGQTTLTQDRTKLISSTDISTGTYTINTIGASNSTLVNQMASTKVSQVTSGLQTQINDIVSTLGTGMVRYIDFKYKTTIQTPMSVNNTTQLVADTYAYVSDPDPNGHTYIVKYNVSVYIAAQAGNWTICETGIALNGGILVPSGKQMISSYAGTNCASVMSGTAVFGTTSCSMQIYIKINGALPTQFQVNQADMLIERVN